MATPCCPTDVKPVVNNYKGTGTYETFNDLKVYVAGADKANPNKWAIINIYDIFGSSPHTEQFADRLSDSLDCLVCVPDLIVNAWPPENVPPTKDGAFPPGVEPAEGVEVLYNWIMTHNDCRVDRADDLKALKEALVSKYGIAKIGAVGMCWGAKVAFTAAIKNKDWADAVAACHGSFLDKADAETLEIPMCLLNSKDEPPTYESEIKPVLESKSFKNKNVFKNFPNMHHGWMGTRGAGADTDFAKKELVDGFQEGINDLTAFFAKALA